MIEELAARFGVGCWFCGLEIRLDLRWPHPGCATVEHIIPRAEGGVHAEWNLALAHKACNEADGWRRVAPKLAEVRIDPRVLELVA